MIDGMNSKFVRVTDYKIIELAPSTHKTIEFLGDIELLSDNRRIYQINEIDVREWVNFDGPC